MTVTHGYQPLWGLHNVLRAATIDSDDALGSFPAAQMVDGRTATQAGFAAATGVVVFDLGSAMDVDFVGLAKHTLATQSATLVVEYSATGTSGPWTSFLSEAPANDGPHLWEVSSVSAQYWRVSITGHAGNVYVGDVTLGEVLALPAGMPVSFTSPRYAKPGKMRVNRSRNADLVGLSFEPGPKSIEITMQFVDTSWFDNNWQTILDGLTTGPGYFVWNSDTRATEVMFCWASEGDLPDVPYDTAGIYQSVTVKVEGITA